MAFERIDYADCSRAVTFEIEIMIMKFKGSLRQLESIEALMAIDSRGRFLVDVDVMIVFGCPCNYYNMQSTRGLVRKYVLPKS